MHAILFSRAVLAPVTVLSAFIPTQASAQARHPLDALTADEIIRTVAIIRAEARFATIDLAEPPKQQVMDDIAGGSFLRAARALIYDWATGAGGDVVVDLNGDCVGAWTDILETESPIRRLVISRLGPRFFLCSLLPPVGES